MSCALVCELGAIEERESLSIIMAALFARFRVVGKGESGAERRGTGCEGGEGRELGYGDVGEWSETKAVAVFRGAVWWG